MKLKILSRLAYMWVFEGDTTLSLSVDTECCIYIAIYDAGFIVCMIDLSFDHSPLAVC